MTDSGGGRAKPAAESRSVEMASLLSGYVGRYAIPLLLIAELVLFSVLRPESFATINNFRAILDRETVLVLLAFAAMMPLIVGEFDLSVASNLSFAQLIVVGFAVNQAFPAPVALICTLAVGMIIGLVNGVAVVKLKVPSIVATLATGTILEGISLRYSARTILGAPDPLTTVFRKRVFEDVSGGLPLTVVYALVIALIVWFVLSGMPTGRRMYAVGGNRRAVVEGDGAAGHVEPDRPVAKPPVGLQILERLVVAQRDAVLPPLPGEELLGQGRAIIRSVQLVADQRDRAFEALAPKRLSRADACQRSSDDRYGAPRHGGSHSSSRSTLPFDPGDQP